MASFPFVAVITGQYGYNKILSEKKSLKNDAQESELKNLMQNNLILIVEDNIALLKNIAELF